MSSREEKELLRSWITYISAQEEVSEHIFCAYWHASGFVGPDLADAHHALWRR